MRWLHISDLHVNPDGIVVGVAALMNRFLEDLKERLSKTPIDCIVFTGDLFNRGAWTSSQAVDAMALLKRIYQACSDAGGWEWSETQPMKRLFYCPGNHDVLRGAYSISEKAHVLYRKKLVAKAANLSNNGQFAAPEDIYELLTEKTFGQFFNTMEELCGNDNYSSEYKYEYRVFNLCDGDIETNFIGVNTALLAAQEFDSDSIDNELQHAFQEFMHYHVSLNTQKALDAYRKYDVAVNKKLGNLKNDQKNLCFISAKAQSAIQSSQKNKTVSILFGHHPISFLSQEAAGRANLTAENNSIYLYLCGHMHKPHGESVEAPYESYLGTLREAPNMYQVTVGGLFSDKSGYNEISYSIGELVYNNMEQLSIKISVFVYAKDVFGDFKWHTTSRSESIAFKRGSDATNKDQNKHGANAEKPETDNINPGSNPGCSVELNTNDKDFRSRMLLSLNLGNSDKEKEEKNNE